MRIICRFRRNFNFFVMEFKKSSEAEKLQKFIEKFSEDHHNVLCLSGYRIPFCYNTLCQYQFCFKTKSPNWSAFLLLN